MRVKCVSGEPATLTQPGFRPGPLPEVQHAACYTTASPTRRGFDQEKFKFGCAVSQVSVFLFFLARPSKNT